MGSYLSEPKKEKTSTDESNDKLSCGASSMQGWRLSQEDAHNCLLDYDTNTSFFAVFDGHGGHEVAAYCSQKLPDFIKNLQSYKDGDIEKALIEGFLGFDATITTDAVIEILKEIAGENEAKEETDDEDNVNNLYEEAAMPIEQVIEKYTSNLLNPAVRALKKDEALPKSPCLKAKKESDATVGTSSSEAFGSTAGSSSKTSETSDGVSSSNENCEAKSKQEKPSPNGSAEVSSAKNGEKVPEIKVISPDSSDITESKEEAISSSNTEAVATNQNGGPDSLEVGETVSSSSTPQENGEVVSKGKGKAPLKKVTPTRVSSRPKRKASELYKKILDFVEPEEDEESEDEDDKTFEGPNAIEDSDDEEADTSCLNDSDSSGEDDAEEEEGEDSGMDGEEDEDEANLEFARNMKEEPGSDSGCTAVVALLKGNELFVANAGDSRCIVCRNGQAIEMSFDHKPEDEPERQRIVKAGGKVTADGRVNSGLNLSRAIGDHAYKQNKELSDKEQMITALPDIKKLTIDTAEDEFMVLACDGIWNYMSSQEVVDFVRPRVQEGKLSLSGICEELFDHCLAPDTGGDGTGCDNMTGIIVQFKKGAIPTRKRSASPEPEVTSEDTKKRKTDEATA